MFDSILRAAFADFKQRFFLLCLMCRKKPIFAAGGPMTVVGAQQRLCDEQVLRD
ncbi:hypothetical protein [Tropicibacter sp. Alg240-R139]|uniref:hypothetical protein n=1 Tax=Tropicibacter sp. Alg240-R139 TaxID=2305991 RepID=UPI0013E088D3|nr:hypothetical protein [Tropicibacter sp. Alg240-R139]